MKLLRFLPTRWWSPAAWKSWGSYVHWRLETYGVYYPDGHMHVRALIRLVRQLPSYYRWMNSLDRNLADQRRGDPP